MELRGLRSRLHLAGHGGRRGSRVGQMDGGFSRGGGSYFTAISALRRDEIHRQGHSGAIDRGRRRRAEVASAGKVDPRCLRRNCETSATTTATIIPADVLGSRGSLRHRRRRRFPSISRQCRRSFSDSRLHLQQFAQWNASFSPYRFGRSAAAYFSHRRRCRRRGRL